MRSASLLTSTTMPLPSHTTMPSGAASSSARNGTSQSRSIVEPDAEGRPGSRVLDPDPSAVRLDRRLAERQAEPAIGPRGSFLAGHEPLEHALAERLRHARPRIDHLELDAADRAERTDPDGRPARRVANRVVDQVREHAVDEIAVDVQLPRLDLRHH